ncbi:HpaII family restriction endonuclease [Sneathia vaginalis]|uniref:HpaII family restriction endonuclease n=1 Tax=Sneathia vaginalis TaxID=187101 RepID=UPI00370D68B6
MGLNKGEWSELYTLFYLLINRKIKIVDSRLNVINEGIFEVKEILSKKSWVYFLLKDVG